MGGSGMRRDAGYTFITKITIVMVADDDEWSYHDDYYYFQVQSDAILQSSMSSTALEREA